MDTQTRDRGTCNGVRQLVLAFVVASPDAHSAIVARTRSVQGSWRFFGRISSSRITAAGKYHGCDRLCMAFELGHSLVRSAIEHVYTRILTARENKRSICACIDRCNTWRRSMVFRGDWRLCLK